MSATKQALMEQMEKDAQRCCICGTAVAKSKSCIRCGEAFQVCVDCTLVYDQCDYCEHMTTKDD